MAAVLKSAAPNARLKEPPPGTRRSLRGFERFMPFHVEPLARSHDRASFSCGVAELDAYLHRQARQDMERGLASVFVLTPDGKRIAAFYTLSALSLLPECCRGKLPPGCRARRCP